MVSRLGSVDELDIPAPEEMPSSPSKIFVTASIMKWETAPESEGGIYVYGKCTGDNLDLDDQIIDRDFARDALNKWFTDWANVRQMHSTNMPPAGKAILLEEKPDGFYIKTHVVEPTAVTLVKNEVYKAYSIGISRPRIVRDIKAKGGRVVGGIVSENSLVDFPANPTCKFMIAKRAKDGHIKAIEKVIGNPEEFLGKKTKTQPVVPAVEDPEIEKTSITAPNPGDVKEGEGDGDDGVDLEWDDSLGEAPQGEGAIGESTSVSKGQFSFGQDPRMQTQGQAAAPAPPPPPTHPGVGQQPPAPLAGAPVMQPPPGMVIDPATGQPIPQAQVQAPPAPGVAPAPAVAPVPPAPPAAPAVDHAAIAQTAAVAGAVAGAVHAHVAGQAGGTAPGAPAPAPGPAGAAPAPAPGAPPVPPAAGEPPKGEGEGAEGGDAPKPGDPPKAGQEVAKRAPTYGEQRLHDALCCAYSAKAVKAVHPSLRSDSLAAIIDPTIVHKALSAAIIADAGTGSYMNDILALQTQYSDAICIKNTPEDVLDDARNDLHKVFTDMYPDTKMPTPTNMSPGSFRRPYVSGGRAPLSAPGMDNAMPDVPSDADTPEPGDFTRGPITDGRQDDAPESTNAAPKPKPGQPGRVYYTSAARAQAANAMQSMHDHIAGIFPDLCPMGSSGSGAVGSGNTGEHGSDAPFDNRANAQPSPNPTFPQPGTAPGEKGTTPELTKAERKAAKKLRKQEHETAAADIVKMFGTEPDVMKAFVETPAFADVVNAAVVAQNAELTKSLSLMQERIRELESMPDPTQAPIRGSVAMDSHLGKRQQDGPPTLEERAQAAQAEEMEYLERLTKSGNPELRMRAEAQLTKIMGGVTPTLTD